jgi:hypothetical protein
VWIAAVLDSKRKRNQPSQRCESILRGASNALVRGEFQSRATEAGLVRPDAIDEPGDCPIRPQKSPHTSGTEFLKFRLSGVCTRRAVTGDLSGPGPRVFIRDTSVLSVNAQEAGP